MTRLTDHVGNIRAYLYNNIIIDSDHNLVSGIILGDCVFGKDGEIVGKLVHNFIYTIKGEIAAGTLMIHDMPTLKKNLADLNRQAWTIMGKVKNHIAPWINPTGRWSVRSLVDILEKQ